jgi:hypothetical protein
LELLGHRGGGWVIRLLDGTLLKGNTFGPAPPVPHGPFLAAVRLRRGGPENRSLKEFTTRLLLQTTVASETPLVLDNVLAAAGRSAKAADGAAITVRRVERLADKGVRVELSWERALGGAGMGLRGGVGGRITMSRQIEIAGASGDRNRRPLEGAPRLLDANGKGWELAEWTSHGWTVTLGQVSHRMTLVYRPGPARGEPARLAWPGQRAFAFEVTATFKDIPLP